MKFSNLLNETKLGRVWKNVEENCMICISALRHEIKDEKTRQNLTIELRRKIKQANFGFTQVVGSYLEKSENSDEKVRVFEDTFMVFFKPDRLQEAKKIFNYLCKKFNQEAYLLTVNKKAYYVFQDGSEKYVGKFTVNSAIEYYTQLLDGKKFVFHDETLKEDFSGKSGLTPTEHIIGDMFMKEVKKALENNTIIRF